MEEQYVSFETAKMLKEAGFDCKCSAYYHCKEDGRNRLYISLGCTNDDLAYNILTNFQYEYLAPTQALAAKWLRGKYGIYVSVEIMIFPIYKDGKEVGERTSWGYYLISTESGWPIGASDSVNSEFNSYEEALEAGLQRAIEIIKNKAI